MIDAPVVWIAPASGAPSAESEALLTRFAAARGFRITAPGDGGTITLAIDPHVVAEIEAALLAGRDAITRLDADALERDAAHALTLLHAHPELPQAAWLAAEAHRLLAARFLRAEPRDAARAEREWISAGILDGGRAPALGEQELGTAPAPIDVPVAAHPGVALWIDGLPTTADRAALAPGEHHALLRRGERTVAATWFGVRDATPLAFAPPSPPLCSREDLSGAALEGTSASAPTARCPLWIAADGSARDVLRVAVCEGATCGAFVELRRRDERIGPIVPPGKPFPVWIPITIGAVALVATTALVLWAAGVFESTPTVIRFEQGNVQPTGKLP